MTVLSFSGVVCTPGRTVPSNEPHRKSDVDHASKLAVDWRVISDDCVSVVGNQGHSKLREKAYGSHVLDHCLRLRVRELCRPVPDCLRQYPVIINLFNQSGGMCNRPVEAPLEGRNTSPSHRTPA